jgi:UDP-N-acetyl-D-mannosaminuronic acid dehydrogenase
MSDSGFTLDVVVVGGCGHVGLPLALAFADRGLSVGIFDIDPAAIAAVQAGRMPFAEPGAQDMLEKVLADGLELSADASMVSRAEHVVVVVGTPIDEHLNPSPEVVPKVLVKLSPWLRPGQLVVLRSTVYPGVTAMVERELSQRCPGVDVVFCPERIAEGKALDELFRLPQLVAGRDEMAVCRAEKLFGVLTAATVRLSPEEAELAKLFTNSWRYLKFAVANQLYMIANNYGLDYERIRSALAFDYPRAADLPTAGLAAGPCLLKDTMQLAAFNNNNFVLGHAAMMINEGLPLYIADRMEQRFGLADRTIGILGMAFKAESDDIRASLSYKLKRILRFKAARVLCCDPYVQTDPDLSTLDEVLEQSDLLVIGAPHQCYRGIQTPQPVVDIWNLLGHGVQV